MAFIDDDRPYLDALQLVIPDWMAASYHVEPDSLGLVLEHSRKMLQEERELLSRISLRNGLVGSAAVSAALEYLASPVRFDIVALLVADFGMPRENGVNLCQRFRMAGMQRLLLTGMADQAMAISAFNAGAIEQYVPKQATHLLDELVAQIQAQIDVSCDRRSEVLLERLPTELRRQLATGPVVRALDDLLQGHHVTEWVLVPQPQGLVCVTADGSVLWVQLENEQTSRELAEGLEAEGWDDAVIGSVLRGDMIVDLDFASQIDRQARAQAATELQERPRLAAAVFEVRDLPDGLRPATRQGRQAGHQAPA
ncbi:hypothetical protein ACFPOE_21315 [Caenimonas terrae]|uniref:Response regulatory domain-containing protein n=1 Tax=Caenimonas terrae TaxID=696074 RepID=A0ABW0NJ61_9BURK